MTAINGSEKYAESVLRCPPLTNVFPSFIFKLLRLGIFNEVSFSKHKIPTTSNWNFNERYARNEIIFKQITLFIFY
jgi:hypothetical protein